MVPVISLDVLPADVPALHAPAMVQACSSAVTEGSCALAAELPESTSPEAVALVLWQGEDLRQVTVRVGRRGGQWFVRALTFLDTDSIVDRWTTVGLTVATLAGETLTLDGNQDAPTIEPAPPPVGSGRGPKDAARPAVPSSEPVPAEPQHRWLGSLGALSGPGWDGGDWQRGAWVAVTFRAPRLPLQAHVVGSFSQSRGPTVAAMTAQTEWLTAGLGAGLYGSWPQISLIGSAALELAYRHVETQLGGKAATDDELPLRLRLAASAPASGILGGTVGVLLRVPPHNPRGSDASILRAAAVTLEAFVGLEARL